MENNTSLTSNFIWKFTERITAQLVSLVVSIILARMLEPSHYGIVSIVTIFITLANVFVSDGFGSALIQKKNADALDFNSVLYFNIGFSILLYLLLFFVAPSITSFYGAGYELLTPVLRVLGLRIILTGINSVQQAYVSRHMIFKAFFWSTLFGTVVSAVVGITMAYLGFGVWALVAQYLTNTTIDTLVLNRVLKLKPSLLFSTGRLKKLLNYGIKILGANLLITSYQELRALIIGKAYSSTDLAYFDKGKQFPNVITTNINASISAVLFPEMANHQDDLSSVKRTTRSAISFSSFVLSPIMLGLAAVAEPFVRIVLTDKWLSIVPLLQLFCVVYLFNPIHTANMQAIKAIGRSDVYLKLEILKKAIELIAFLCVFRISILAITIVIAIQSIVFTIINAYPNIKLLNYTLKEQIIDLLPNLSISILMAIIVYLIGKLPINICLSFGLQIIIGILVFLLLSIVTKNKNLDAAIQLIKGLIKK